MKNLVWTEKYRPKKFEDFIGDTEKIKNLVKEPLSMPNFLFVSKSPGTGKTSLAYVIRNEIKCPQSDFMVMNSSDERKIEHIRGRVKDFCRTMRSRRDVPRVILCDEADGMLSASQDALRFLMEKYSGNCKFIMTANSEEKIIDPIKSRCVVVRMKEIDKNEINIKLQKIIGEEKISVFDMNAVEKIIDMHYPDMRQMINHLQELAPNITLDRIKTKTELEDQYYELLKQKKPFDARKFLLAKGLDPHDTLKRVLENVLGERDETQPSNYPDVQLVHDKKKEIIYEVAETSYRIAVGADPDIQMFRFALKFCDMWG